MKKTLFLGISYLSIIINLILLGVILKSPPKTESNDMVSDYKFLSRRIFVEQQNEMIVNFVPLRQALNAYIQGKTNLGVYFEYLPSGVSIGINDKDNFIIASLLKVPLAMGVYKEIERGRIKENDLLTIEKEDIDIGFGTLWEKGIGTKITVKQALEHALQESDNTASNLLLNNIASGLLTEVFDYLDIPKELNSTNPVVTPKNYSSILRSLYLSSYLTPKYSNKLIEIMTNSKYNDKMRAPIPESIKVAHKIGVHETDNPSESIYTDCGIIYVPKRPYILCIMTKEESEKEAAKDMQEISSIIYYYVANINQNN